MLGHSHGNTKVFLQVLQVVLSDEGFKIGTSVATQALYYKVQNYCLNGALGLKQGDCINFCDLPYK